LAITWFYVCVQQRFRAAFIQTMTSPTLSAERQFIDLIAGEVHAAVRRWMGEIEQVLDSNLSDGAKLQRIRAIAASAGCNSLKEHGPIV
jgi:hypothetical protein